MRLARAVRRWPSYHAAHLRASATRDATPRSALPPGTLHGGEPVADWPDSRAGRHSHAVLDLRLLSWREDARIRAGTPELDVRGAQFSGCGDIRHAGVRPPSRTLRADDGVAIGGHADGQPRHGVGPRPPKRKVFGWAGEVLGWRSASSAAIGAH